MLKLNLCLVFLLAFAAISQGRELNRDTNEHSLEYNDTPENNLKDILDKIQNTADKIQDVRDRTLTKIQEKLILFKELPEICSLSKDQTAEFDRVKNDDDYCQQFQAKLREFETIAKDGAKLLFKIGFDASDILAKLTVCSAKPVYVQIGCFLKTIAQFNDDLKEVTPEIHQWLKDAIKNLQDMHVDFDHCYLHHQNFEKRLENLSKAALMCAAKYQFVKKFNA